MCLCVYVCVPVYTSARSAISNSYYYYIRALRHIWKSLTDDTVKCTARAIVGSRLDYDNTVLVGVSVSNTKKLHRVQDTLARFVTQQCGHASASQSLAVLHRLLISDINSDRDDAVFVVYINSDIW